MALMAELIHGGGQHQDLARAARELQA
jgi:hypothetical protein